MYVVVFRPVILRLRKLRANKLSLSGIRFVVARFLMCKYVGVVCASDTCPIAVMNWGILVVCCCYQVH